MSDAAPSDVTQLLNAIQGGDRQAAAELLPVVYQELRQLARQRLAREAVGQTLDATALVHEAYLRLVGPGDESKWSSRGHFFAAAAEAMRRILLEAYRRKQAPKGGGGAARVPLDADSLIAPQRDVNLIALDEALNRLAVIHPPKAELVKLRYFAGLSLTEAAQVLGISRDVANRHWKYAKAWLHQDIRGGPNTSSMAAS